MKNSTKSSPARSTILQYSHDLTLRSQSPNFRNTIQIQRPHTSKPHYMFYAISKEPAITALSTRDQRKSPFLTFSVIPTQTLQVTRMTENPIRVIPFSSTAALSHGQLTSNPQSHSQAQKQNIWHYQMLQEKPWQGVSYLKNFKLHPLQSQSPY